MQAAQREQRYEMGAVLYMAMELSNRQWKLGFSAGGKIRRRMVPAGDCAGVLRAVAATKAKWGLAPAGRVVSCYEAGRDGFWIHRWLRQQGIGNEVVDAASIEVSRRARQAKTDRLDVEKLVRLLMRYHGGEQQALRCVRVPSVQAEDQRRLHRERERLLKERTQHRNRLQSLLVAQGVRVPVRGDFGAGVDKLRNWDGQPLPPDLQAELRREWERYEVVQRQVQTLEALQKQRVAEAPTGALAIVQELRKLRAVPSTP